MGQDENMVERQLLASKSSLEDTLGKPENQENRQQYGELHENKG